MEKEESVDTLDPILEETANEKASEEVSITTEDEQVPQEEET